MGRWLRALVLRKALAYNLPDATKAGQFEEGQTMPSIKWLAVAVTAAALFAAGCAVTRPIVSVTKAPVTTTKANPSLEEVGKAIAAAGLALGWQMRLVKPGQYVGTLNLREHVAVVEVNYTAKDYSIVYKDSTNLMYDGANIHRNYNGWVQNLDNRIRAHLVQL